MKAYPVACFSTSFFLPEYKYKINKYKYKITSTNTRNRSPCPFQPNEGLSCCRRRKVERQPSLGIKLMRHKTSEKNGQWVTMRKNNNTPKWNFFDFATALFRLISLSRFVFKNLFPSQMRPSQWAWWPETSFASWSTFTQIWIRQKSMCFFFT